jgi:signal transduction histidine kinase/CheY-like chemotaxis protein
MAASFIDFLDRQYSDSLVVLAVDRSRARILALSVWMIMFFGAVLTVLYLISYNREVEALVSGLSVIAAAIVLSVLKKGRSLSLAGNAVLGILFSVFSIVIFNSGGLRSDTTHWLLILPVLALLVTSRKNAFLWFGFIEVEIAFLAASEATQWFPLLDYPPVSDTVIRAVALAILTAVAFGIVAQFDVNLRLMLQELINTHRELETARREAERANLAKSAFLAGMSHELRTPLNAIIGFSQVLHDAPDLNPAYHTYSDTMLRSGQHLLHMINEVLDLSKIEAGKMDLHKEAFDLPALLRDVFHMFELPAKHKKLTLRFDCSGNLPCAVHSDPSKLRQILINLLGNAVKFTDKGEVALFANDALWAEVEKGEAGSTFSEHRPDQKGVLLRVVDSGPGISSESLKDIFEPFKQIGRQDGGTGLGLAITWQLIRLLGGEIRVTSRVTGGTTVRVFLPLESIDASLLPETVKRKKAKALAIGSPSRILLVDDVPTNVLLLRTILEPLGFTCFEAHDGRSAYAAFEECNPEVVLLDIRLPDTDGIAIVKRWRSSPSSSHVPVLAVTASVFEETEQTLLDVGFTGVLLKPFHIGDLIKKLETDCGCRFQYSDEPLKTEASVSPLVSLISADSVLKEAFTEALMVSDMKQLLQLIPLLPVEEHMRKELIAKAESNDVHFWFNLGTELEVF